jgi:hypothetical protein
MRESRNSPAVNPRHAAAFAIMGWYLMTPPTDGNGHFFKERPLSRWTMSGSFDSVRDCIASKQDFVDTFPEGVCPPNLAAQGPKECNAKLNFALAGECIATDDPRLKGN